MSLKSKKIMKKLKGFTLVELVVVMALVIVMTGVTLSSNIYNEKEALNNVAVKCQTLIEATRNGALVQSDPTWVTLDYANNQVLAGATGAVLYTFPTTVRFKTGGPDLNLYFNAFGTFKTGSEGGGWKEVTVPYLHFLLTNKTATLVEEVRIYRNSGEVDLSWTPTTEEPAVPVVPTNNTFTLTYAAGSGGTISGTTSQTVNGGASGTAVTAMANTGFQFVAWSDVVITATRTDTNITTNKAVTANFCLNRWTHNGGIITGYIGPGGAETIPVVLDGATITSIGAQACATWYGRNPAAELLTSLTIPDSVTSIGDLAFYSCGGLTSVDTGNGVISIGWSAFEGCNALTRVTMGTSVTSIGETAFNSCDALTSVTLGSGVTSIGRNAFMYCSALPSVTFPTSLTSIGMDAFFGCYDLTSVTIPPNVTSIGKEAFNLCGKLTNITVAAANGAYSSDASGVLFNKAKTTLMQYPEGRAGAYVIPASVTSIVERAAQSSHNLTSVTIPVGVTSIGQWTFGGCYALSSVTLGSGVISIGDFAFYGCTALPSVTIPASVTSLGAATFGGCKAMTSVTIGRGITSFTGDPFPQDSVLAVANFLGNAPSAAYAVFVGAPAGFYIHRLPAATGWRTTWSGRQVRTY